MDKNILFSLLETTREITYFNVRLSYSVAVLLAISEDRWSLFHVQSRNSHARKEAQNCILSEMAVPQPHPF